MAYKTKKFQTKKGIYYFYDKIYKEIIKAYYSANMIGQYEYHILTGERKGISGFSCGFDTLIKSDQVVVGKLKTLKVLYAKV